MPRATQLYKGNGSNRRFPIAFEGGYLSQDYVKVYTRTSSIAPWVQSFAWTLIGNNQVEFAKAPATGIEIMVRRETPGTSLVNFSGASRVTEKSLDVAAAQGVQVGREAKDLAERNYWQAKADYEAVKRIADAAIEKSAEGSGALREAQHAMNLAADALAHAAGVNTRLSNIEQSMPRGIIAATVAAGRDKDARRPTLINGQVNNNTGFYEDVDDELDQGFSGDNRDNTLINQASVDLGETVIALPDSMYTSQIAPDVPIVWREKDNAPMRVLPVDIRTVLYDSLLDPGLFRTVSSNGTGTLYFSYQGDRPLRTVIKGSLNLMASHSRNTSFAEDYYKAGRRMELFLRCVSPAESEMSIGDQLLARSPVWLKKNPDFLVNYWDIEDYCSPLSAAQRAVVGARDSFAVSGQPGYFSSSVFPNVDQLNTSQPGYLTTSWIDLGSTSGRDFVFALIAEGSNNCDIRFKTESGQVVFWPNQSSGVSAHYRAFRLPYEAKQVQICYAKPGHTAAPNPTKFVALDVNMSYDVDPAKGMWTEYNLNVCRDVTFYPKQVYCLDLYDTRMGSLAIGSGRDDGYRILSGSLSFMSNVAKARKELATTIYRA